MLMTYLRSKGDGIFLKFSDKWVVMIARVIKPMFNYTLVLVSMLVGIRVFQRLGDMQMNKYFLS